ncbi:MAG: hypothetical protein U0X91_04360 [Spirosomataceae bacterium]
MSFDQILRNERNNPLKFLALGYSSTGKTYWLGSQNRLRFNIRPHGFQIRGLKLDVQNEIETVYNVLSRREKGAIFSTLKANTVEIMFKKRFEDLFQVNLSDIYGQATEVGRNPEETTKLLKIIPEQDGVLIFIKAPSTAREYDEAVSQLMRQLDLASPLLKAKRKIPIALVITQMDKLSGLTNIKDDIEREFIEYRSDREDNIEDRLPFIMGDIINSKVKEVIDGSYIKNLIEDFHTQLKGSNAMFRVFPSSSLGFDNAIANPAGGVTEVADGLLSPYGTLASFLWMIYAFHRLNPSRILNNKLQINELMEEINHFFITGQAYHDSISKYLNLRDFFDMNN